MAKVMTQADVMDWLATLPDEYATAVFCDPPYGLGFMGKQWDHGVPSSDVWREVLRVCKPGAVLLAFGGTRTEHRLAVNIEDAGWEIYDKFLWLYGSGFPKSANIGKMIDKAAGAEREVAKLNRYVGRRIKGKGPLNGDSCYGQYGIPEHETAPATPDAATWDGYGTALKPAYEPVIVARKPRRGTYAQMAVEHGTGALWIDGCRVGTESTVVSRSRIGAVMGSNGVYGTSNGRKDTGSVSGRWPANLALVHDDGCERVGTVRVKGTGHFPDGGKRTGTKTTGIYGQFNGAETEERYLTDETVDEWRCVEGCPVRMLGEQSGETGNSFRANREMHKIVVSGMFHGSNGATPYNDTGTAARFFYQAKASRAEREAGLDGMEERGRNEVYGNGLNTATKLDPSMGHTADSVAARPQVRNHHPTVKPLAVCEYMARLILPPEVYRDDAVLLVPYAGSGSEMIGAWQAGWRNVEGCEREAEYVEIARRRIAHWCKQGRLL